MTSFSEMLGSREPFVAEGKWKYSWPQEDIMSRVRAKRCYVSWKVLFGLRAFKYWTICVK